MNEKGTGKFPYRAINKDSDLEVDKMYLIKTLF